eukprot:16378-Amphidinium_carterae.1
MDRGGVIKRTFANLTRMLCFVGLEGTGHHYFNSVMAKGGFHGGQWPGAVQMFQYRNSWNQWGMQLANRAWKTRAHGPNATQPPGWQRKSEPKIVPPPPPPKFPRTKR